MNVDDIRTTLNECCGPEGTQPGGFCESWGCRQIKILLDEIDMLIACKSIETSLSIRRKKERDRYRRELEKVYAVGHNDDCIFCGFKDKTVNEALQKISQEDECQQ